LHGLRILTLARRPLAAISIPAKASSDIGTVKLWRTS
jgi:hypothetical protein